MVGELEAKCVVRFPGKTHSQLSWPIFQHWRGCAASVVLLRNKNGWGGREKGRDAERVIKIERLHSYSSFCLYLILNFQYVRILTMTRLGFALVKNGEMT